MEFLLFDGSYYVYHRYYSLHNWWSKARRDDESTVPFENERFIEKYKTTFVKKMHEVKKKYMKTSHPVILAAKDCCSRDIWRRQLYDVYKHGRKKDEIGVKDSFKIAYSEDLFTQGGVQAILSDNNLEADDCIAITVRHLNQKYPDANIVIITSDMDYLQLANDKIKIYNLNDKELIKSSSSFNNAKKDLFCKIVAGDKSDNIKPVFSRCGIKTAAKYFENRELFNKKLHETENAKSIYELNTKLIDFDSIPQDLVDRFKQQCLKL